MGARVDYETPDDVRLSQPDGDRAASALDAAIAETAVQKYVLRQRVAVKRDIAEVERAFLSECRLGGEDFYYAWGTGKDHIEGPTIHLCMALARCWGNCAVDTSGVQDLPGAWVITAIYCDLETGYTLARQFWQAKNTSIFGKHDPARKNEMRFGIGQSKASRNVVRQAMPEWLIHRGMKEAKKGVRERIEKFIADKGHAAAVTWIMESLLKEGVSAERVLTSAQKAKPEALEVEDLVRLRGALGAIQSGQEFVDALFPPSASPASASGGKLDALADEMESKKADKASDAPLGRSPGDDEPEAIAAQKKRLKAAAESAKKTVAEPVAAAAGELFGGQA